MERKSLLAAQGHFPVGLNFNPPEAGFLQKASQNWTREKILMIPRQHMEWGGEPEAQIRDGLHIGHRHQYPSTGDNLEINSGSLKGIQSFEPALYFEAEKDLVP